MTEPAPPPLPASTAVTAAVPAPLPGHWQHLPARGAALAAFAGAVGMALLFALLGVLLAITLQAFSGGWWKLPAGMLAGMLLGGWLGWRRHRRTSWRLDDNALAVRRDHWWHSETRVPRARVQHLDLRRGPLERTCGLATLVVHTAGSHLHAVSLSGLAVADAETLRELLARPDDHDGL